LDPRDSGNSSVPRFRPLADAGASAAADDCAMGTHITACKATVLAALVGAACAPAAEARETYGNKWRVTSVDIGGIHHAYYSDGDRELRMDGSARYEGRGQGKPFVLRLSDRRPKVITAPVTYIGQTAAVLNLHDGGSYACDYDVDEKRKLVGVVWVSPNGVRVQWTLVPIGFQCPVRATFVPQFDTLSAKTMTTKFPVRRFTGKTAVIPVRIKWTGGNDGWQRQVTWLGKVKIARG
jgi:hypothetical protein